MLACWVVWLPLPFGARPPPDLSLSAAAAAGSPFGVGGAGDPAFASLEAALAAARDGDTILIHGNGPYVCPPLTVSGKALTIRAGPGYRPQLRAVAGPPGQPWQALLETDRALTVEGVDFSREAEAGASPDGQVAHLVYCDQAPLRLVDCQLEVPNGSALVVCRNAPVFEMRNCRVRAAQAAVCVEASRGRVPDIHLAGNTVTMTERRGVAFSLWAPEARRPAGVRLRLEGNTVQAGRVVALAGLSGGVDVTAEGNTFAFGVALLSYVDFPGPDGWRQATHWRGRNNRYDARSYWLSVDSRPAVRTLTEWQALWQAREADSAERPPAASFATASREGLK
jgi:hypothetical protein